MSDQDQAPLQPIELARSRLRGRNVLLGNKMGMMLHLPAANGMSPRTIHRSKWFGASILGRKFLEAIVTCLPDGTLLSRRLQEGFTTDGLAAERRYATSAPFTERYFVPDYLPAILWTQDTDLQLKVELYFDMRFYRGSQVEHGYHLDTMDGAVVVCRDLELVAEPGPEGIDTGGTPETVRETLWAACRVSNADTAIADHRRRWRPMWYSLDAARRRYLRTVAARHGPVEEHAPLWEMASEWVYSPVSITTRAASAIAIGFGVTSSEAIEAASECLDRRHELESEKRARLAELLTMSSFSTGHAGTDRAYGHILSRVADCLAVEDRRSKIEGRRSKLQSTCATSQPAGDDEMGNTPTEPRLLAGNAYFQESWNRDENIALGGLLATGQYHLAGRIIDSTWQRQDDNTGRLPLRQRRGEISGYTSSDGTLWALIRLAQYTALTGDGHLLNAKLPMVAHFIRRSLAHCRHGLLPSGGIAVEGHQLGDLDGHRVLGPLRVSHRDPAAVAGMPQRLREDPRGLRPSLVA